MGDCLLLTASVRALKEEFPDFRISVAVESKFEACYDGNADFAEVIAIQNKASAFKLLLRRFHLIINLHGGPTSLLYSLLAWGPRVGGEKHQYRWLYSGVVPSVAPHTHSVDATMAAFRTLGLRRTDPAPAPHYTEHPNEAEKMKHVMRQREYVVIHPGALLATKRWAATRFAAAARALQEEGLTVVITGGPSEDSVVSEVARNVPNATILLGLTIPELAELIRAARLYIGNDSGPMHLAAAVGTPVVVPWGSSDSQAWHPWRVPSRVVQNPFECNPCPGYRCLVAETPLCIESVTVDQVTGAAKELMK